MKGGDGVPAPYGLLASAMLGRNQNGLANRPARPLFETKMLVAQTE